MAYKYLCVIMGIVEGVEGMSRELLKGFTCECGKYHKYGMYYYAHYDEAMIFTCPDCGTQYRLLKGKAEEIK